MAASMSTDAVRLVDLFQDDIVPSFSSTESFIKFARSKNGLCLDPSHIQQITEQYWNVEEQKMQMLFKWKEIKGPAATPFSIRSALKKFLYPDSEKGTQLLDGAVGGNGSKKYINQQPPGKMTGQLTHDKLPGCEHILYGTVTVNFSFPSGMLEGISYPAQEFTAYLPGGYQGMVTSWDFAHELLTQAFNAGLAFKLEVVEEEQKGKIVPDIPLKTNKRGGVKNNGYPDGNYLKKLYQALKSKGFENEVLDRRLKKSLL